MSKKHKKSDIIRAHPCNPWFQSAFSLIEILIVVSILGILAAIVFPQYQNQAQLAKESAAKENLRILRSVIERYAFEHNDTPPGYPNGNSASNPVYVIFVAQLIKVSDSVGNVADIGTQGYPLGPYLKELPPNPFAVLNENMATILSNSADFPADAPDSTGWIYKPATKDIRLNTPGTDTDGTRYYDY